jgi:hypothetical protein
MNPRTCDWDGSSAAACEMSDQRLRILKRPNQEPCLSLAQLQKWLVLRVLAPIVSHPRGKSSQLDEIACSTTWCNYGTAVPCIPLDRSVYRRSISGCAPVRLKYSSHAQPALLSPLHSPLHLDSKFPSKSSHRPVTLQMKTHSIADNVDPTRRKSSHRDFGGTTADRNDMAKLRLKQETERIFKQSTMAMFACAIIATGQVIITSAHLVVDSVGTAGLFWGFVSVAAIFSIVYTSIAEMTSIVGSHAIYQATIFWLTILRSIRRLVDSTHGMLRIDHLPRKTPLRPYTDRISMFAPKSCERYLSFETGWLISIGWTSGIVSIASLWTLCIQGLITLHDPEYVAKNWHSTLFIVALLLFANLFNVCFARWLPYFEAGMALVSIGGIFIVCLVLLLLLPRNNPHDAFMQFTNNTDWDSVGTAFMIKLLFLILAILGFDCTVHMCMSQPTDEVTTTY